MYILAIETTGPYGSVALLNEKGQVCAYEDSKHTLSHLKDLIPMVEKAVRTAGISKKDIGILAPSIGPGSFTGIRIGVSTARALAQALGIKCIPVPTLDSFLYKEQVQAIKGEDGGEKTVFCAILNARRGQVYGLLEGSMEAGPYMLTDVLGKVRSEVLPAGKNVFFLGDGVDAYGSQIELVFDDMEGRFDFAQKDYRYQDAVSVGKWALAQIEEKGLENCIVNYEALLPEYMRKAEAEQKLEAGELPICKGPRQE